MNYLDILLAAIGYMVVGFLWYGPLFGKAWMKLSGISDAKMNEMKKEGMVKTYGMMFVAALVTSFILSWLIDTMEVSGLTEALWLAAIVWLGFIATSMFTGVLFSKKPWNLYFIESGYQLAAILVAAATLYYF